MKVYILSLGCSRNLVDSETLQGFLVNKGIDMTEVPEGADIAIVNTCGFIQEAKEESIDMILQLAQLKDQGKIKRIIVTGCLTQRYPDELKNEIDEIDAVFGSSDFKEIPIFIEDILKGEGKKVISETPSFINDDPDLRVVSTPNHYAYIKTQEGCSNRCAYCVIPDLRGPLRSRDMDSLLSEAGRLKAGGDIKELIVVAQDTTVYGKDKAGSPQLPKLLNNFSEVMKDGWVRLLYTHPAHFSKDLIDVISERENICRYIDLPIQHINDRILSLMNRKVSSDEIRQLIKDIRDQIKNAVIRTTVIVGFPGETDEEFEELLDFLEDARFDRLGAFIYSLEEGTPAASFKGHVPDDIKMARFDRVMSLQKKISEEKNAELLGKTLKVLIDEKAGQDEDVFAGRSYMDAPEVDGVVFVKGEGIQPGNFYDVKITGATEYDLEGEII